MFLLWINVLTLLEYVLLQNYRNKQCETGESDTLFEHFEHFLLATFQSIKKYTRKY